MRTMQASRPTLFCMILFWILTSGNCNCVLSDNIRSGKLYEQICEEKGYNKAMDIKLEPKIFKPDYMLWSLAGIEVKNKVASMNEKGEFCFLEISDDARLSLIPIVPGFPKNKPGMEIVSDKNIIWEVLPGGVKILDIDQKTISNFGEDSINKNQNFIADHEKKLMFVKIHEDEDVLNDNAPVYFYYFLYDIINSKKIFTSEKLNSNKINYFLIHYPFDNQFLIDKNLSDKKGRIKKHKWQLTDLYSKKIKSNKLTNVLDKLQISQIIKTNTEKRRMFVYSDANGFYYILSWDTAIKDVRYSMLRFPSTIVLRDLSPVDPEFNWFVGFVKDSNPLATNPEELVAYRIDDSFPSNILGPIRCGTFHPHSRGVFMNHQSWGMCYVVVENYKEKDNMLYVFPLDEGLKLLKQKK